MKQVSLAIPSGHYFSNAEIQQMLGSAYSRGMVAVINAPMLQKLSDLEGQVAYIAGVVDAASTQERLKMLLIGKDDLLRGTMGNFRDELMRLGLSVDDPYPQRMGMAVFAMCDGIRRVLNNNDKGDSLKIAVDTFIRNQNVVQGRQRLMNALQGVEKPGRDREDHSLLLGKLAKRFRDQKRQGWGAIGNQIQNYLNDPKCVEPGRERALKAIEERGGPYERQCANYIKKMEQNYRNNPE